jgi:hypothetical protein
VKQDRGSFHVNRCTNQTNTVSLPNCKHIADVQASACKHITFAQDSAMPTPQGQAPEPGPTLMMRPERISQATTTTVQKHDGHRWHQTDVQGSPMSVNQSASFTAQFTSTWGLHRNSAESRSLASWIPTARSRSWSQNANTVTYQQQHVYKNSCGDEPCG